LLQFVDKEINLAQGEACENNLWENIQEEDMAAMVKRALLSIDGGGIRGIIPLCALIELEKQIGKPARQIFSMMAGTSTGSIIAGGLAMGSSAEKLLELYQSLAQEVFRFDLLSFTVELGSYRYRIQPLADLLQRYLGDITLNQLPIDIMIPATRVSDGKPWYFVRDTQNNAGTTGKLHLVDCMTASAAAPTYFEPYDVPGIGVCVDGGLGIAGNPIYQACVEAFYYTPSGVYVPAETTVISLGTGHFPPAAAPKNLIEWVSWVVGELLHVPADQQTELVLRHFQTAGTTRINPQLPRAIGMDDVTGIPDLIKIGQELASHLDWQAILAGQMAIQPKPVHSTRDQP
jgi:Patatin-like phospholipase